MRPIKFRVWDKIDGEMKECALLRWYDGQNLGRIAGYWNDGQHNGWTDSEPDYRYELMQFTGLTDRNGVEIYESDIVDFAVFDHNGSDTSHRGVVTFAESEWQIWNSVESEFYGSDGGFHFGWVCAQDDEIEIVGNVHEHAHLLEQPQPSDTDASGKVG